MTNFWKANGQRLRRPAALLCLLLPLGLAGCGAGDLISVSGKVTCAGKPVTGGTLIFSPMGEGLNPGRPASAEIQPDGTYTLGTNDVGDGVQPGPQRVSYTPPAQQLTEAQRTNRAYTPPPPPYRGMVPKQSKVEIAPETTTLDIELVPALKH